MVYRHLSVSDEEILRELRNRGGSKSAAAARLGISPATLRRRLKSNQNRDEVEQESFRKLMQIEAWKDAQVIGALFRKVIQRSCRRADLLDGEFRLKTRKS
jgi:transposase-like protein